MCAAVMSACGEAGDVDPEPTVSASSEASPGTQRSATSTDGGTDSPGPVTVGKGQEHRVTEASTVVVVCESGGDVTVEAAATVTVSGPCDDVDVDGSGATVTFETARDLGVDGSDNTVTGVRVLELDVGGDRNEITVKQLRAVDLEGSDNVVTHGTTLTPQVDDEGKGNSVVEG